MGVAAPRAPLVKTFRNHHCHRVCTSWKLQKLQHSDIISIYIGVLLSIIRGATVTKSHSPYFLHFSLSFPTKSNCFSTSLVHRLAGLQMPQRWPETKHNGGMRVSHPQP